MLITSRWFLLLNFWCFPRNLLFLNYVWMRNTSQMSYRRSCSFPSIQTSSDVIYELPLTCAFVGRRPENFQHNFPRKWNEISAHVINTQMTFDCAKNILPFLTLERHNSSSLSLTLRNWKRSRKIYLLLMRHFLHTQEMEQNVEKNFHNRLFECKKKFALMIVCCR